MGGMAGPVEMPVSVVVKAEGLESLVNTQQYNVTANAPDVVSSLHEDNVVVVQRESDGYIDATKMAATNGKLWADYFRRSENQKVLSELAQNMATRTA